MVTSTPFTVGAVFAIAVLVVSSVGVGALTSPVVAETQDVASITFDDQTSDGTAVTVDAVALPDGGFVVVREVGGNVLGASEFLDGGRYEDVTVRLDETLVADTEAVAVAHRDTNGNRRFDAADVADWPYGFVGEGPVVEDSALVRIEERASTATPDRITVPVEIFDAVRGLVGYWQFDAGTGTTAVDSSGNGNAGTIHGANWTDGRFDTALRFDGRDDYVDDVGGASVTDGNFTVSLWATVPPDASGDSPAAISMGRPENWPQELFILYVGDDAQTENRGVRVWWGGNALTWDSNVADGEWHHLVLTKSGGELSLYAAGERVATGTTNADTWNSTFVGIGATNDSGTLLQHFGGQLDDVRIYDRVLTPSEIRALANQTVPGGRLPVDRE